MLSNHFKILSFSLSFSCFFQPVFSAKIKIKKNIPYSFCQGSEGFNIEKCCAVNPVYPRRIAISDTESSVKIMVIDDLEQAILIKKIWIGFNGKYFPTPEYRRYPYDVTWLDKDRILITFYGKIRYENKQNFARIFNVTQDCWEQFLGEQIFYDDGQKYSPGDISFLSYDPSQDTIILKVIKRKRNFIISEDIYKFVWEPMQKKYILSHQCKPEDVDEVSKTLFPKNLLL